MHGRNRSDYKRLQRDPENAAKLAHKASQWHTLSNELLRRRQQQDTSSTSLALIDKLLTVNPDPLYLWNHRREIFSKKPEAFDYSTELILTQTALQNNPKAYGPWFHRKWVLQQLFLRENNNDNVEQDVDIDFTSVLEEERALIAQLLTADERNFHGWNYRRFLVSCQLALEQTDGSIPNGSWWNNTLKEDAEIIESFSLMGAQIAASDSTSSSRQIMAPPLNYPDVLQQEWNYSLDKIVSNFSNASALYFRSQLLPLLVALKDQDEEEDDDDDDHSFALHRIIPMELELVENAVFTEPDDQTAWWYQKFLFDFVKQQQARPNQKLDFTWFEELVDGHAESLRELVEEVDGKSKWPYLGLIQALEHTKGNNSERREILEALVELDTDRKGRYLYMIQKIRS